VLLNAAFHDWHGGSAFGPRYLSAGLPFLCLALAPLWTWSQPIFRVILGILGLCGAALSLIAVSTNAEPPLNLQSPVQELLWPAFRIGHLGGWKSSNLGQAAGLSGFVSLVPLLLIWVFILAAWAWLGRPIPERRMSRVSDAGPSSLIENDTRGRCLKGFFARPEKLS
jgi:hypothetical protein